MEQVKNSVTLDILQSITAQNQLPKAGGKADGDSDFQKLMDKAAADSKDAQTKEVPKAETPTAGKKLEAAVQNQKQENSLERIKRLLEQGAIVFQPNFNMVTLDGQTYKAGEFVEVWTSTGVEFIPVTDLDDAQMMELQQMLGNAAFRETIDVSDPEADAMLELTDPTVDHSPAALLEKVTAEQFGKTAADHTTGKITADRFDDVADSAAEMVQPEDGEQSGDPLMEVIDAGQAPQPLFHDVKAAPVKVGEVYEAPETKEANVVRQVDAGVAQALEKGEPLVRIRLNPENLGSVTVEITRSAEGVIRVALSAHSGETRNLLERHAGELQGLLGSRTQQNVEVNVQRQQESQQNQNQNHNYDGHNGHAQDGGQRRQRRQEQSGSQDFIQQLRLGLIPMDGGE